MAGMAATPEHIETLVQALEHGSRSEQRQAAAALGQLAALRSESRDAIARAGAIPELVRLLPSEDSAVFEAAADALTSIMHKHGTNVAAASRALYRSRTASRQTVASALSRLQRSRDGRVKEAAGMLAACLLEQAGNLTSDAHIG